MAAHPKLIRHKPLDVWTLRERLLLASSVLQSGDQNWVSVSRAIKNHSTESRSTEYFSQKNCALQYGELLENAETPKRKRSEKNEVIPVETQGQGIVNKLKVEYMEQLVRDVKRQQEDYQKLSDEIKMVSSGYCDEQLSEIWEQIQRKQGEKQKVEPPVSVSQSETSVDNEQTLSSLATSAPDVDDTSTQDSQEADIEVDDHTQDVPEFIEEITATPVAAADQQSPEKQPSANQDTSVTPTVPLDTDQTEVVETTEVETTVDSLEETATESLADTLTESTADSSAPAQADVSAATLTDPASQLTPTGATEVVDEVAEVVVEEPPAPSPVKAAVEKASEPAQDKVTELVHSEPRLRAKSRTSSKSRQSSETSTVEDITVDDEVMPKPTKMPSPVRSEKPTSQLTINVVPADVNRSVSPEPSVSSTNELKSKESKEQATPTASTSASLRRSSRVTKLKDEKKEESTTPSVTKSTSEPEPVSDEEGAANSSKVSEATPASPTTSHQSEAEDEKSHKSWKKTIMMVWRTISHHKYANVFMHQVTDDIAPGYSTCVHRPMSLLAIKQNVEKNVIKTTEEFTRDIMLMFINAIMYNNHEYDVYAMAQEMYDDALKTIQQHTQSASREPDPKPLTHRGRRSEASTDKDIDKSRRRSSADQHPESSSHSSSKKRKTRADD